VIKPTRCNNQMFIINFCLNMFRASLCPTSGEQRPCYCIWCTALDLLDVVGSGCGALRCRMRAMWRFDMLRQKLIINIWLLHLVWFSLSSHFAHGARSQEPNHHSYMFRQPTTSIIVFYYEKCVPNLAWLQDFSKFCDKGRCLWRCVVGRISKDGSAVIFRAKEPL